MSIAEGRDRLSAVLRGESRSYRLDRVQSAEVTSQSFAPRFAVELTSSEFGAIPPTARGIAPARGLFTAGPRSVARALRASSGPTYIYQCGLCGKRFKRKTRDSGLRPHKTPQRWPCSGRTGWLVRRAGEKAAAAAAAAAN